MMIGVTVSKRPEDPKVQIFMKTLTGGMIPVQVRLSWPVLALMEEIRIREGIPVDQQRLVFSGRQLEGNFMQFYKYIFRY